MNKLTHSHLSRIAYIYIRQSKPEQVQHNVESQRRQYGLTERARQLGFHDVHVIDEDLGRSARGHVDRHGFEDLLAAVCQGRVGAVFAVDASRLARNGHEWHRLLEFCGIVDTLLVDHDGVYDLTEPNDRLLLGMKGTLSEMETATFRQRSQEAIRQMARRGEYYTRIPEGYVLRGAGRLEKDPDERVRRAIELVFSKFRELGSARQVSMWFRQEQVPVPKRKSPLADAVTSRPERGAETAGEGEAVPAGSVASASLGPPRGLHRVAGVSEESGTAGAKSERPGRGRIGGSSSGQRSAGRAGALWPLRTKDARPVQRPPLSPLFGRVLLLRCGRARDGWQASLRDLRRRDGRAGRRGGGAGRTRTSPHGGHAGGRRATRDAPDREAAASRDGTGASTLRGRPMRATIRPGRAGEPAGGPHAGIPLERGDRAGPRPGTAVLRTVRWAG